MEYDSLDVGKNNKYSGVGFVEMPKVFEKWHIFFLERESFYRVYKCPHMTTPFAPLANVGGCLGISQK